MCEYCDKMKAFERIGKIRKRMLSGEDVCDVTFSASAVIVFCNFDEHHTPINYCPMCGRKLQETAE